MDLADYVAGRIRELRTAGDGGKGISQEAMAKAVKTTANTISRWETGFYRPSLEDLDRLARFFRVSIVEFFPKETLPEDEPLCALLRAAKGLKEQDIEELRRYAEFKRARSVYEPSSRRKAGRVQHRVP